VTSLSRGGSARQSYVALLIVKPVSPEEPEKVQIAVHGADDLYREIRVENTLENAAGEKVRLKQGAEIDVIIEAPPDAVEKKPT
jgi:hypothetical protein